MFGDIEVEKHKFHQHKSPIVINNVAIIKIVVSNSDYFDKKCFKYPVTLNLNLLSHVR